MNIGEAAKKPGVSAKMIRYYEESGLVPKAGRSSSGYRRYSEVDVHILRLVRRARDMGFPMERISALLKLWSDRSRKSRGVKKIALTHVAALEADIEKLVALRDVLRHLARRCHGDDRPQCPIIEELSGDKPAKGH